LKITLQKKLVKAILDHIDDMTRRINDLDDIINNEMKHYEDAINKIEEMPGIGKRSAEVIIAEIGVDMSRFPTAAHLASWSGLCPGNNESAGKRKSGKTNKGSKHLKSILIQCAKAAKAKKESFFYAQYQRLVTKRGANRATVAVGMQALGRIIFWFALVSLAVLLPVILKRIFVVKGIPEPAIPTITILAAPTSLCLAGYLNSFETKSTVLVYILLIAAQVLYWGVILYMPRMLKLPFYPSYSGFTFPLVISGIALKLTNGFLTKSGNPISFLPALVTIEEIIAAAACIYVLIRYFGFLIAAEKAPVNK
jgi:hypothetical protein